MLVHRALVQPTEAAKTTREWATLAQGNSNELYNVASSFALCVPLARGDQKPELEIEAVQTLRHAMAAGWNDAHAQATIPILLHSTTAPIFAGCSQNCMIGASRPTRSRQSREGPARQVRGPKACSIVLSSCVNIVDARGFIFPPRFPDEAMPPSTDDRWSRRMFVSEFTSNSRSLPAAVWDDRRRLMRTVQWIGSHECPLGNGLIAMIRRHESLRGNVTVGRRVRLYHRKDDDATPLAVGPTPR